MKTIASTENCFYRITKIKMFFILNFQIVAQLSKVSIGKSGNLHSDGSWSSTAISVS